jgi:hypothetical protein
MPKSKKILEVRPITLRLANDFVEKFHRHNQRTQRNAGKFAICAVYGAKQVGVAIVGRPLARLLDDGLTVEITRLCVNSFAPKGVCSFLYSRCARIWKEMGGRKLITYTLESESGASLRGAGWRLAARLRGQKRGWEARKDSPQIKRKWQSIYGKAKLRWEYG